jgi:hypothetical protein
MVDPLTGLRAAKQIDEALGLIAKLLGKLRAQPDIAAIKLSAALDEIVKTYRAVDEALTEYVSLAIDRDGLDSGAGRLVSIAGGSLSVSVGQGRGHCHQIQLIYREHLVRWFERVFNGDELADMERVFSMLGSGDWTVFDDLARVVDQLQTDAKLVLADVIAQRQNDARQRVLQTYQVLAPIQQQMATGMTRIFELKDTFIGLVRAT